MSTAAVAAAAARALAAAGARLVAQQQHLHLLQGGGGSSFTAFISPVCCALHSSGWPPQQRRGVASSSPAATQQQQPHHHQQPSPSASSSSAAAAPFSTGGAQDPTAAAEAAEADVAALRGALLQQALSHVPHLGWTSAALTAAARDLQLSPAAAGLLPRGPAQLVEHFVAASNAALAAELAAGRDAFLALPLRERISGALRRRLEMHAPLLDSWPQALSLLAQPANAPSALALLAQLLDCVWYAAGDEATDGSWYAKRAALAAIYTSSELYMLTDYSPGFTDTWQQLERRVDDALWLISAAQSVAGLPAHLLGAVLSRHSQQQQQQQQAAMSSSRSSSSEHGGVSGPGAAAATAAAGPQPDAAAAATAAAPHP